MQRLVLFAKRPIRGRVKTRLTPPLEADQALELYRAFLIDQIAFLNSFRARHEVELCLDGAWNPDPPTQHALGKLPLTQQGPGDLGRRMLGAVERNQRAGAQATVIIAADAPTLPADRVEDAFRQLSLGTPAVVAPARDGGYVLLGMTRPFPELFREIPWGGGDVLECTLARARENGLGLLRLDPWYDVDDTEGLRRLRRELSCGERIRRAPETARILAALDSPGSSVV